MIKPLKIRVVQPKQEFDVVAPYIKNLIERRKNSWTLSTVEWEDVSQLLFIRSWQKYHLFDPSKASLDSWINTLVSNGIKNMLRDWLYKTARPCIQGCSFNTGGNSCSFTKSGEQCNECKLFKKWQVKKSAHHNISMSVSIENHSQEINNIQSDFMNIEEKKGIVDRRILEVLKTQHEKNLYKLLFIDNIEPEQVSLMLKYKSHGNSSDNPVEYQVIVKFQKKIKGLAKEIIENEDLLG